MMRSWWSSNCFFFAWRGAAPFGGRAGCHMTLKPILFVGSESDQFHPPLQVRGRCGESTTGCETTATCGRWAVHYGSVRATATRGCGTWYRLTRRWWSWVPDGAPGATFVTYIALFVRSTFQDRFVPSLQKREEKQKMSQAKTYAIAFTFVYFVTVGGAIAINWYMRKFSSQNLSFFLGFHYIKAHLQRLLLERWKKLHKLFRVTSDDFYD